jgi:hypothetical protein
VAYSNGETCDVEWVMVRPNEFLCARRLFDAVRFQPQGDETFRNPKHFLDIRERCRWIIVVVHEPVFVIAVGRDFIDDEPRFL